MTNDELAQEIGDLRKRMRKDCKRLCTLLTIAANRAKDAGLIGGDVHALATTPKD